MPPQATENAVAGHMWPTGRLLPTTGLSHNFKPQHVVSLCTVLVTISTICVLSKAK